MATARCSSGGHRLGDAGPVFVAKNQKPIGTLREVARRQEGAAGPEVAIPEDAVAGKRCDENKMRWGCIFPFPPGRRLIAFPGERPGPVWPDRAMSRFMPIGIDFSGPLGGPIYVSSGRSRPIHQIGLD
jgi:hypothetical protein